VADHEGIDLAGEVLEDGEFVGVEVFAGEVDDGKFVMGVERGAGVAGVVFAAGEDAFGLEGFVEGAGVADDLGDVVAVAASAEGVVGFVVEGDIEDGTEVEIEAEHAKEAAGDFAVAADEVEIAFIAELVGIRRLVADELEAGDAAAFLIDGDDGLDDAEVTEVVDEFAKLGGRLDVATEEDEAAGLEAAEDGGGVGVEDGAGDAGEEELAEG
jgi:hypothetical protein